MKLTTRKLYLFTLRNGKKKFANGHDPQEALRILSYRLTPMEMEQITDDPPEQIRQQDMQRYVKDLG